MKLNQRPQIGFIPLGTMNDFARTIRLSTKKTFLAKNIDEGNIISSDIGAFNEVYFNYVAALGAFTAVPYVTTQKLKKRFGKLAYFIVGTKCLRKLKTYRLELNVNKEKIVGDFIFGSVSNSKSIGGFEWFERSGVKINDGEFEMLFIKKPRKISNWIGLVFALLFKQHHKKKYFEYFQTSEIQIKSETAITWTLDGEYGGRKKEVNIKNIPMAIDYIIPM